MLKSANFIYLFRKGCYRNMNNEEKFIPTVEWMKDRYAKLNKELFNGELGYCDLMPFTTGKGCEGGRLGYFSIKVEIYSDGRMYSVNSFPKTRITKSNFVALCKPVIKLNANYYWTEEAMQATLVHEMCHYYTYMNGTAPKQGHGPEFYAIGEVVASRSNGKFTIQRLASAEQMSNMQLNDKMLARKEKRKSNKKANTFAVFRFNQDGAIELTTTTSKELVNLIVRCAKNYSKDRAKASKIIVSQDAELISKLFDIGYSHTMKKYKYWPITDKPWAKDVEKYQHTVLYDDVNGKQNNEMLNDNSTIDKCKMIFQKQNEIGYALLKLFIDNIEYDYEEDCDILKPCKKTINGVTFCFDSQDREVANVMVNNRISISYDSDLWDTREFFRDITWEPENTSEDDTDYFVHKIMNDVMHVVRNTLSRFNMTLDDLKAKKKFVLKLTNGNSFECDGSNREKLVSALKERFPNMKDEVIAKLIDNPNNYQKMNENKKTNNKIIKEVINNFLLNEIIDDEPKGKSIVIDYDTNLGICSPLEMM